MKLNKSKCVFFSVFYSAVLSMENQKMAEMQYTKLFKQRRVEHIDAIKSINRINDFDKQKKFIKLMTESIFKTIENSRPQIELSGFVPGISEFPSNLETRDALSNILENTALYSELLLKFPDTAIEMLKTNNNWDIHLQWAIAFCHQLHYLFDKSTLILLNLVQQELNHTERDPNYMNPYRIKSKSREIIPDIPIVKKRFKKIIKRPRLHEDL